MGAWFGSITPPDPTRIVSVPPATYPISTDVAELAIPSMLWCSASQNRVYPHLSACRARSSVLRKLSAASPPSFTEQRSRIEYRVTLLGCPAALQGCKGIHHARRPRTAAPHAQRRTRRVRRLRHHRACRPAHRRRQPAQPQPSLLGQSEGLTRLHDQSHKGRLARL